jgi:hypothetical protein
MDLNGMVLLVLLVPVDQVLHIPEFQLMYKVVNVQRVKNGAEPNVLNVQIIPALHIQEDLLVQKAVDVKLEPDG